MRAKIFSLEEANSLIPILTGFLKRIKELRMKIESSKFVTKELFDTKKELASTIQKTYSFGCIIKDLELGLVDFYFDYQGKIVLLCWRYGENEIKFWHSTTSGYADRKPLELLKTI